MEVGARRWTLRHESRFYGTQQLRNLFNAFTSERGIWSALAMQELLFSENRRTNKGWITRVPATAVIPGAQVIVMIIWFKAFVGGLESFL